MDENRHIECADGLVKVVKLWRVERQTVHLRSDCHTTQAKDVNRSMQFIQCRFAVQNRRLRQADETAWVFFLNRRQVVVDETALVQRR